MSIRESTLVENPMSPTQGTIVMIDTEEEQDRTVTRRRKRIEQRRRGHLVFHIAEEGP